jgi:DNA-binding MarR family transcriptional regulator
MPMTLTRKQETVLATIVRLGKGTTTIPVTISAIHATFSDMDVSDLVLHLGGLIDNGLIKNAQPTKERIGNTYVITPDGFDYYNRNSGKHP